MIAENDHGRIFSNVLVKWSFIFKLTPKWSRQNGRLFNIMPLTKMIKPGIWITKMIKDMVLINVFASPSPFNIVQLTLWLGKEELSFWRGAPCPLAYTSNKNSGLSAFERFLLQLGLLLPLDPSSQFEQRVPWGTGFLVPEVASKNTHKNTLLLPYCFSIRNTSRMEWSKRQGLTGGTLGVRRVGGRAHRRSGNGSPRTSTSPAHYGYSLRDWLEDLAGRQGLLQNPFPFVVAPPVPDPMVIARLTMSTNCIPNTCLLSALFAPNSAFEFSTAPRTECKRSPNYWKKLQNDRRKWSPALVRKDISKMIAVCVGRKNQQNDRSFWLDARNKNVRRKNQKNDFRENDHAKAENPSFRAIMIVHLNG